jgi:transmembrane sensor
MPFSAGFDDGEAMRALNTPSVPTPLDAVHETATEWLLRLREPTVTPQEFRAWQAWMGADTRNADAFHRMEEVEEVLRILPRPALLAHYRPARMVALAASVLVVVVLLGWAASKHSASLWATRSANLTVATGIGENRSVRLADGSTVVLGGNSRIDVRYSEHERHIDLADGEAFFKVAHDSERPLTVSAGHAVVVAVGTEFDVRCGHGTVLVSVVEGRVRVEPRVHFVPLTLLTTIEPTLAPIAVSAGQETTVDIGSIRRVANTVDLDAATSWTSGRLVFRMEPLQEVLEQVNRYSRRPIVLGDPAIAGVRVTGTVDADNVEGWVASLGSALGIGASEQGQQIVLRKLPYDR